MKPVFASPYLDDFEKLADTVPAYEKLKARADVNILLRTAGFAGENRARSSKHGRAASHARTHLFQRQ